MTSQNRELETIQSDSVSVEPKTKRGKRFFWPEFHRNPLTRTLVWNVIKYGVPVLTVLGAGYLEASARTSPSQSTPSRSSVSVGSQDNVLPSQQALDKKEIELSDVRKLSGEKKTVSNYEVTRSEVGKDDMIVTARPDGESVGEVIAVTKISPEGKVYLDQIGKTDFKVSDVARSTTNSQKIVAVGSQGNKGMAIFTNDGGQNWQKLEHSRGPFVDAIIPNGGEVFIIQGDPKLENYPSYLVGVNTITSSVRDLNLCADCGIGGMPGSVSELSTDTYTGYTSADPRLGYTRKTMTSQGIIKQENLRSDLGYIFGTPLRYIENGLEVVTTINNFTLSKTNPNSSTGTFYQDRFDISNNYALQSTTKRQAQDSLYPSSGININSVVYDSQTKDLYLATVNHSRNPHNYEYILTAYIEDVTRNRLIPNDEVWVHPSGAGSIYVEFRGVGIADINNQRRLLVALAKINVLRDTNSEFPRQVFTEGRLVSRSLVTGNQWEAIDLFIFPTHRVWMPLVVNNSK